MIVRSIRRGCSDTWRYARAHLITSITAVVGIFGISLLVTYLWRGEEMLQDQLLSAVSGAIGVSLFLTIALVWNKAASPYRIERDARKRLELEAAATPESSRRSLPMPSWSIRELILHIDPDVLRDENSKDMNPLRAAELKIMDQASIGNLRIWGREYDNSGMNEMMGISAPLVEIPRERWREFFFNHHAIFGYQNAAEVQVSTTTRCTGPLYSDLRVIPEEAKAIWPSQSN